MSDAQIEYHIKDRTSFRDFLGIQSVDDVPDGKGPKKKAYWSNCRVFLPF